MSGWLRGVVARSRGAGAGLRPAMASAAVGGWRDDAPSIESASTPHVEVTRASTVVTDPAAPVRARAEPQSLSQPPLAAPAARTEVLQSTAPAVRPQLPARVEPPSKSEARLDQPDTQVSTTPSHAERVTSPPLEVRAAASSRTETSVPPIRPALPARTHVAVAPARPVAAARAAQALAVEAPEPAPDVHIHIGRIELTALTAPAPRRAAGAPAHKPMSLDDYLGRRNREQT